VNIITFGILAMGNFGKRLKEERERLGLSQTKFAEACGVGKTAQFNYERGERSPSSLYLDLARELGVDTHYVATGTRTSNEWADARSYLRLLAAIEMLLGLEENIFGNLCKMVADLDEQVNWVNDPALESDHSGNVNFGPWFDAVLKWLSSSTKPDRCIDMELFTCVLSSIESHARETGSDLSPDRKARATVMLYRVAKRGGNTDRRSLDELVKLAVL
jgi:transcriptional regulator with XRE-family HTH domain